MHVYGKLKKRGLSSLEEFDPRPPEYRGTANAELGAFLGSVWKGARRFTAV